MLAVYWPSTSSRRLVACSTIIFTCGLDYCKAVLCRTTTVTPQAAACPGQPDKDYLLAVGGCVDATSTFRVTPPASDYSVTYKLAALTDKVWTISAWAYLCNLVHAHIPTWHCSPWMFLLRLTLYYFYFQTTLKDLSVYSCPFSTHTPKCCTNYCWVLLLLGGIAAIARCNLLL